MDTTSKYILSTALGLFALFLLFFTLSNTEKPLSFELKKAEHSFTKADSVINNDSVLTLDQIKKDSNITSKPTSANADNTPTDSSGKERVLLIGDSQLEGLHNPVYNYCNLNNHNLVASILWYGSSTKTWGETDTLSYFLKKYKPTYLFIAIGLNELFVTDMDNRRGYIKSILASVKKAGVRYFWIGPAAWKKDKGITSLLAEMNGALFYPSHTLKLERAKDKMHPSKRGARIWMDSVATYVTSLGKYGLDLSVRKDTTMKKKNSPLIIIAQQK